MKHVVLYVGHLYKLFWTKKIWPGWQGGSKNVKIWPRMDLAFIYLWPQSLLEAPKCVKDPWNTPKMIPPTAPDWFESISIESIELFSNSRRRIWLDLQIPQNHNKERKVNLVAARFTQFSIATRIVIIVATKIVQFSIIWRMENVNSRHDDENTFFS